MNKSLIDYQRGKPLEFLILIILYCVGASSIPNIKIADFFHLGQSFDMLFFAILKALTVIFPAYLLFALNEQKVLKFNAKSFFKSSLILFPFYLICLNNIPFVSVLGGNSKFIINKNFPVYCILCLAISVFEEICFRGLVLQNLENFKKINTLFKKIVIGSLIFSACHLVNAFSFNVVYLLMQLGYSFLIGLICCFSYYASKSLYMPIILHFIFDFGGLMTDYGVACGNIWDKTSIITTVILSIFTVIYGIFVFIKFYKEKEYESSDTKGE